MFGWLKRKKDPKAQVVEALGDQELPSFPAIVLEALSALRNPSASLRDVGAKLSTDPGVSVQLLKVTNSAAVSPRNPVKSVEHAVSLLGRSQVESLLLSVGVARAVAPAASRDGFDSKRFWLAAGFRAAVARVIASKLHPATRAESFTAALLEDMAIPLIAGSQGKRYGAMIEQAVEDHSPLHVLEQQEFGWDHGAVGGALCMDWKFPDVLSNAVGGHHASSEELPPAVQLTSVLGMTPGDGAEEMIERGASAFNLSEDDAVAAIEAAHEEAASIASSFT